MRLIATGGVCSSRPAIGGVTGCGMASDAIAPGRPLFIRHLGGLASAASNASSRLFYRGLRHLASCCFGYVPEATRRVVPLIIRLRFSLPHRKALRSAWPSRPGPEVSPCNQADARKLLPWTRTARLAEEEAGAPDGRAETSRLIASNAGVNRNCGAALAQSVSCTGSARNAPSRRANLAKDGKSSHAGGTFVMRGCSA